MPACGIGIKAHVLACVGCDAVSCKSCLYALTKQAVIQGEGKGERPHEV